MKETSVVLYGDDRILEYKTLYTIVRPCDIDTLQAEVQMLLKDGWELQGGVSAISYGPQSRYMQAMVKYEEVDTE